MRPNRRTSRKMSVVAQRTMYVGAIIVALFGMTILNLLMSSSCTQLMKSIGEKRRELVRLEDSRQREAARWEGMITPDRLDRHLARNGLSMHYAKPAQTIRMSATGYPYPGQFALTQAEARARRRNEASAALSTPKRTKATPQATRRNKRR